MPESVGNVPLMFAPSDFSKSRRSDDKNRNCVMVARRDGCAELRDDKVLHRFGEEAYAQQAIRLTEAELDSFFDGIRAGCIENVPIVVTERADGMVTFRRADSTTTDVELVYTGLEIEAFYEAVHNREFDPQSERATPGRSEQRPGAA